MTDMPKEIWVPPADTLYGESKNRVKYTRALDADVVGIIRKLATYPVESNVNKQAIEMQRLARQALYILNGEKDKI